MKSHKKTISSNGVTMVPLSAIVPDADQPRKHFDPLRLSELRASIEKEGIINPLAVQDLGNGTYLLEDGERRYRASKLAGLKEVPVIINDQTSDEDRLVRQFHLQEQHQGWSPSEKAMAAISLSKKMGLSVSELSSVIALPKSTVIRYIAFAKLVNKEVFVNSGVGLNWALSINALVKTTKNIYEKAFNEEFTPDMVEALEVETVERVSRGEFAGRARLAKLTDAFNTKPELIKEFVKNKPKVKKDSVDSMYLRSDARLYSAMRVAKNAAKSVRTHLLQVHEADGGSNMLADNAELRSEIRRLRVALHHIMGPDTAEKDIELGVQVRSTKRGGLIG